MPRTKQITKTCTESASARGVLLKKIAEREAEILNELDAKDLQLADLEMDHELIMNCMKVNWIRYKDVRLKDLDSFDISSITTCCKARVRPKIKRSMSDTAINDMDAGPLLSASKVSTISSNSARSISSNVSGSTHRSGQRSASSNRAKANVSAPKTRRSRSLTRTQKFGVPPDFGNARSTMRTPLGQRTAVMTPITPKMKDYDAHPAVMRRPKQNEIAVSLQGSPLMVNAVMTDGISANIPLADGRVIALQPQNMRFSDIADITLGQDSLNDLQQLRDNLTKLCENSKRSRYNKH